MSLLPTPPLSQSRVASESPEQLVKHRPLGPTPRVSDSVSVSELGSENLHFEKAPGIVAGCGGGRCQALRTTGEKKEIKND